MLYKVLFQFTHTKKPVKELCIEKNDNVKLYFISHMNMITKVIFLLEKVIYLLFVS